MEIQRELLELWVENSTYCDLLGRG